MRHKLILILACAVLNVIASTVSASASNANQIDIKYVPPKEAEHEYIFDLLRERRALERLQELLSPFRLPRRLTISVVGCDGEADAFYGDDAITICYEYLDELWRHVPKQTPASGIAPIDTVVGPFVDTSLHEFAHALIDMFQLPVLGRLEDAADQVAAYLYMQLGEADARRLIFGTAYTYFALDKQLEMADATRLFSKQHSTPAQRAYNLLCMAYGADIKKYSDIVSRGFLPKDRALFCEEEYEQVQDALDVLLLKHVDQELALKVKSKTWLKDRDSWDDFLRRRQK